MKKSLLLIVLSTLVIACAPSEQAVNTAVAETQAALPTNTLIPPTSTPTITSTPVPPTATLPPTEMPTPTIEPLPGSMPEGILVTFAKPQSGKCTMSGPTELPPEEYTFILELENSRPGDFDDIGHIDLYNPVSGKTTQDLLDHPHMENGNWWGGAFSLIEKVIPDDAWRNETRVEKYYTYTLTKGEIVITRWTQNPKHFFWYCGTIIVK